METTAFGENDPEWSAHLFAQFRAPILAKAHRQLWIPDMAEDACQETVTRVLQYFRSGKRLDDPARLPGFVLTVCGNIIKEMNRLQGRYQPLPDNRETPLDLRPDPYERAVTEERKRLVREILAGLPKRDREILLAVLEGIDRAELCKRFAVTSAYLRVLLHRALKRFQEGLGELP